MNKIRFSVIARPAMSGMLAIYVSCEQFGRSIYMDTGVHIFNDEWDCQTGRIINNPNAKKLNILIRKTLYQLEEFELDYDGDFTLAKLKEAWEGRESSHDFYSMMEYQIQHRDIRDGTKAIHRRVLSHLKRYQSECSIRDLTEDYAKGFIKYMKNIGLCPTTIAMHIHTLRCYYNIARKLYGSKVPCDTFSFYHETKEQQITYKMKPFNDDDIRLIENYISRENTPDRDIKTLERFLFMSYTGVRISDFVSLTDKNFTIENGKMWLSYTSIKTNTPVRIPLSTIFDSRAEQLVNKYRCRIEDFFHIHTDTFNQRLKTACKHAGITKRVSAHVARHTFASRLVNKDVPVTTIQKVIGHRTLRMTMVYAKTSEAALVRQLS